MEWLSAPLIIIAILGGVFLVRELPTILQQRSNERIRIQELKTEEAREHRLRVEAEPRQYEGT